MGTLSGDGYYQDLDDARGWDLHDFDEGTVSAKPKKTRTETSNKDPKYDEIHETIMSRNPDRKAGSKPYRSAFCSERHKIHKERAKNFDEDKAKWEKSNTSASKVFCKCKNCGGGFEAKKADRKRGWARFCSKSCKAQNW